MAYKPLPVGPDVIIFDVFCKHAGQEGDFVRWQSRNSSHYGLPVVPDLIVFKMDEGDAI